MIDSGGFADDASVVAALRAGDARAYEWLVRTYSGRLLAVARRLLRNEEDARDVLQAAFLSAFKSIGSFEGASQLSTWLHRIVVNTALMKLRSDRRKPEESIESLLPTYLDDGHHAELFSDWSVPADQLIEQQETRQIVRNCINQLPDQYRTVLLLRDIEGLSTAEVADSLGTTAAAVKVRLHRARQALATLLRRQFGDRVTRRDGPASH